jgi:hypothetical protein
VGFSVMAISLMRLGFESDPSPNPSSLELEATLLHDPFCLPSAQIASVSRHDAVDLGKRSASTGGNAGLERGGEGTRLVGGVESEDVTRQGRGTVLIPPINGRSQGGSAMSTGNNALGWRNTNND